MVGKRRRVGELSAERFEQNFQGAFFCSNARGGISVGDCVMSAHRTAGRIADYLGTGA